MDEGYKVHVPHISKISDRLPFAAYLVTISGPASIPFNTRASYLKVIPYHLERNGDLLCCLDNLSLIITSTVESFSIYQHLFADAHLFTTNYHVCIIYLFIYCLFNNFSYSSM